MKAESKENKHMENYTNQIKTDNKIRKTCIYLQRKIILINLHYAFINAFFTIIVNY